MQCEPEVSMKLQIVLEPSEEGGFTVYVPSLPGCCSEGDSTEKALANIAYCFNVESSRELEPQEMERLRLILADGFLLDTVTFEPLLTGGTGGRGRSPAQLRHRLVVEPGVHLPGRGPGRGHPGGALPPLPGARGEAIEAFIAPTTTG
jgi:predicted RNase H-like HicB family nuclease